MASPPVRSGATVERRRVVTWRLPGPAAALIGQPGWSGLAALLGARQRSDVWALILDRALSDPGVSR
jgi:hypothetical protein